MRFENKSSTYVILSIDQHSLFALGQEIEISKLEFIFRQEIWDFYNLY